MGGGGNGERRERGERRRGNNSLVLGIVLQQHKSIKTTHKCRIGRWNRQTSQVIEQRVVTKLLTHAGSGFLPCLSVLLVFWHGLSLPFQQLPRRFNLCALHLSWACHREIGASYLPQAASEPPGSTGWPCSVSLASAGHPTPAVPLEGREKGPILQTHANDGQASNRRSHIASGARLRPHTLSKWVQHTHQAGTPCP